VSSRDHSFGYKKQNKRDRLKKKISRYKKYKSLQEDIEISRGLYAGSLPAKAFSSISPEGFCYLIGLFRDYWK
jgi:hypothetical protein